MLRTSSNGTIRTANASPSEGLAPIRLIVADDHPLTRAGLEFVFLNEPGIEVVAQCADGDEAMRAVLRLRPDVLLIDADIPGLDGAGVLRQLQTQESTTRVVLLAAASHDDNFVEAVRLGARGIVFKHMDPQLLVRCVRDVHAGRRWFERYSASKALERSLSREAATREIDGRLTRREVEVARAVARGLANKDIAQRLGVSEGTVKNHLHAIYEKLGLGGRMALLLYFKERALA